MPELMPEASPSLDQWRQLYALATQLKKTKPWTWMTEMDVFGVEIPQTTDTGFISIMGMRGEYHALALYPDLRAFHAFLALHHAPAHGHVIDHADRILEIPQLQLSFEGRDAIEAPDQQIMEQLDLHFRGPNAWPLFRSYRPGFLPWFINAEEAGILIPILEQALQVTPRYRQQPSLLYPDLENTYLIRTQTAAGWTDQIRPVPPPELQDWSVQPDPFLINRFGSLPRSARTVELDVFRLWTPVEEKPDRPFFPYILLLVDSVSHQIAGVDLLPPLPSLDEMWHTVPQKTLQLFENLKELPAQILVYSPRLGATLGPTAQALNLSLENVPGLPFLEEIKTQLLEAAESGFNPSQFPADFALDEEELEDEEWEDAFEDRPMVWPNPTAAGFAGEDSDSFGGSHGPFGTVAAFLGILEEQGALPVSQIDYAPILQAQTITADHPGPLLRDFTLLLEAIPSKGLEITKVGKVPKVRFITSLNDKLAHPIQLGLKRPQPKSYPNVCGLYLLLRVNGLGRLASGDRLVLDEAALDHWRQLNPTEQYFALLESWLVRGNPEILGDHVGLFYNVLKQWMEFHSTIPEEGLQIAGAYEKSHYMAYTPGWYNLALMELFGLITLDYGQPKTGQGWKVERAQRTRFGDALLARLLNYLATEWQEDSDNPDVSSGHLQPIFQPFFAAWKTTFSLPEEAPNEGLHIFKVSLGRAWRRLAIPADNTLDSLADAILNVFGFDFDHLYRFTWEDRFGLTAQANHPYMNEPPATDQIAVNALNLKPGNSMTFLYDFGDHWEFTVLLERIDPADKKRKQPTLLESRGKAPEQYPDWEE